MYVKYAVVCPYCAQETESVWAHGVSRCDECKMGTDEEFENLRLVASME